MKGEIIEIQRKRKSVNGNFVKVVIIRCDDGVARKTYLCPDFRNYARWRPLLKIGQMIDGLVFKDKDTLNADSFVSEYHKPISKMTNEEFFAKYS